MELVIKSFEELTNREVHEIMRVRCAVFVVEQNCPYQDVDDADLDALHVFLREGDEIMAYLRIFEKDEDTARIGKVLTMKRKAGYGAVLLKAGIAAVRERTDKKEIYIEAQCHAIGFYEREGFVVCSEEFEEDGIPHVQMRLKVHSS